MAENKLQRPRAECMRKHIMTQIYQHNAILMSPVFRSLTLLEVEHRVDELKALFANFTEQHNIVAMNVEARERGDQERFFVEVERIYQKVFQGYNRRIEALRRDMYIRTWPLGPPEASALPTALCTTTTATTTRPSEPLPSTSSAGTVNAPTATTTCPSEPIPSTPSAGAVNAPTATKTLPSEPRPFTSEASAVNQQQRQQRRAPMVPARERSRSPARASHQQMRSTVVRNADDLRHRLANNIRREQRVPRAERFRNGNGRLQCNYCHGAHPMFACSRFLAMPIPTRRDTVHEMGVCTNCLRHGCNIEACEAGPCRLCAEDVYHNSVLCMKGFF